MVVSLDTNHNSPLLHNLSQLRIQPSARRCSFRHQTNAENYRSAHCTSMPSIVDLDMETVLAILLELDIHDLLVCKRVRTTDTSYASTLIMHHRSARNSEHLSSPAR